MKLLVGILMTLFALGCAHNALNPAETGLATLHGCEGCAAYFHTAPPGVEPRAIGGVGDVENPPSGQIETGLALLHGTEGFGTMGKPIQ